MSREQLRWPPKCRIALYTGRGQLLLESRDSGLDLADSVVLGWKIGNVSRTLTLGLRTDSRRWNRWTEKAIAAIESRIRYDLNFDAYGVTIKRLSRRGAPASREFRWKLIIRPLGAYGENPVMATKPAPKKKAARFRRARADATIASIQRTMERKFGLPEGSVKLVYPSGRKARVDATVGSLTAYWERVE